MQIFKKQFSKKEIWLFFYHNFLIILGSIMLGFGTAIFLSENTIVAGGLSGIAFLVQFNLKNDAAQVIDIVVWVATIVLWFISLIFLGKRFAIRTLLASIIFPLSLSLFLRVPFFIDMAKAVSGNTLDPTTGEIIKEASTGDLLLCSIFGGLINGAGISLTFLGKGSTGGVDVIAFLLNKYMGMKVSTASLMIDLSVIIAGVFSLDYPNMLENCLVGVIAAMMTMIMIELIYNRRENAFVLDIISKKYEEIAEYILNEMERGVSFFDVEGGYTKEHYKLIRTVLSKNEYVQIKDYLAKVDPEAFCTFTDTNAVFGEGFKENFGTSPKHLLKKVFKKNKDKQEEKIKK